MHTSPVNSRPNPDIPPRSGLDRAVSLLWFFWVASLPLGRLTGLHNTLCVLVVAGTFWATRGAGWRSFPTKRVLLPLVVWAGLSYFWSAAPTVTAARWRSDLLLPVLSAVAAFIWARRPGRYLPLYLGLATGLSLLAVFSAFDLVGASFLREAIPQAQFGSVVHPLPVWYPGVGDASMFAVLSLGPLLAMTQLVPGLSRRQGSACQIVIVLCVAFILAISENRNAWLVFPIVLGTYLILFAHEGSADNRRVRARALVLLAVFCVLVLPVALETATQLRLKQSNATPIPWGRGALTMAERDPRPRMWGIYLKMGLSHPIIGVGYGRLVPAIAYDTAHNAELAAADPAAPTHAHDLFLNLWLQLGFVGLALYLAYFTGMLREAVRRAHRSVDARYALCGIAALLVAAGLRNLTDDFLIFGIASAFWVALGCLLGIQDQRTPSM